MSNNRINGKDNGFPSVKKEPKAVPSANDRRVLNNEERLAFMLYASQQQIRALKEQNAALMRQNADLAQENARLNEALTAQENQKAAADMADLEKRYDFLRQEHMLLLDTAKNEYFLKPVQPGQ